MNDNNNDINSESDADCLLRQKEFGDRFREAREAVGMSVADVADELKLSEETIKALECTQLSLLPGATFTQGYIRSYARLLKLPADEIIDLYNQLLPEKDQPLSARSSLAAETDSNHVIIKLMTAVLLLATIVLLVLWWQQSDQELPADVNESIQEHDERVEDNPVLDTGSLENEAVPNEVVESSIESQTSVSQETSAAPVIDIPVSETPIIEKAAVIESNQIQQPAEEPQRVTNSQAEGDDVIVLVTDSETWAEVQDANNARLYFSLMKKGHEYQLKGQAPFRFFLGNAPSVTLGLNNKIINIAPYIRQNKIAHIEISSEGHVKSVRRQNRIIKNNTNTSDERAAVNNADSVALPEEAN